MTSQLAASAQEAPARVAPAHHQHAQALRRLIHDTSRRGNRMALLVGDAGCGGERIIHAACQEADAVQIRSRCGPEGPLAGFVSEGLAQLRLSGRSPDTRGLSCAHGCHELWYEHRVDGHSPASGRPAGREGWVSLGEGLRSLSEQLGGSGPTVVDLGSIDRMGDESCELLSHLLTPRIPWDQDERPAGVLWVARVERSPESGALRALAQHPACELLHVPALDLQGVREYLCNESVVQEVLRCTGGMPQRIDELLRGRAFDVVRSAAGTVAGPWLDALAVWGAPLSVDALRELVEGDVDTALLLAEPALQPLDAVSGVFVEFRSEAERVARLDALGADGIRRQHLACARWCAADQPARACEHFLEAQRPKLAAEVAGRAAQQLADQHAYTRAIQLVQRVLDAVPADTDTTELRLSLARMLGEVGNYDAGLEQAGAVWRAAPQRADVALLMGELNALAGRKPRARSWLDSAETLAGQQERPQLRAEATARLAEVALEDHDLELAEQLARAASEQAATIGATQLRLDAGNTLGKVAMVRGHLEQARSCFEANHQAALKADLPREQCLARNNLAILALRLSDLDRARQLLAETLALAHAHGACRHRATALLNLGVLEHMQGRYAVAQGHYHDAVGLLKALGNRDVLARVAFNLADLHLVTGDPYRALQLCEFGAEVGGQGLSPVIAAEGLVTHGKVHLELGDTVRAREAIERAARRSPDAEPLRSDAALALACVDIEEGHLETAARRLDAIEPPPGPTFAAELALARAHLARGRGAEPLRAARLAVGACEQARVDVLELRALGLLARVMSDEGADAGLERVLVQAGEVEARLLPQIPQDCRARWSEQALLRELAGLGRSAAVETSEGAAEPGTRPALCGQGLAAVRQLVHRAAPTPSVVLITGESGTGKELVANELHALSPRADRPFIKVNCAAFVESLLMSELFGHERGAFTGAVTQRKGCFEVAHGGTLLLDEVGDLSPATQAALLRVLQEREITRVGSSEAVRVDVRVLAATHHDLEELVRSGRFRQDLYYRLRCVTVHVPPLRVRLEDLPELCEVLMHRLGQEQGQTPKRLMGSALQRLAQHRWPGNVRELENVLRTTALLTPGPNLDVTDVLACAPQLSAPPDEPRPPQPPSLEGLYYDRLRGEELSLPDLRKRVERDCVERAMAESETISDAAKLLGLSRPRLSQLVKEYGIKRAGGAR